MLSSGLGDRVNALAASARHDAHGEIRTDVVHESSLRAAHRRIEELESVSTQGVPLLSPVQFSCLSSCDLSCTLPVG